MLLNVCLYLKVLSTLNVISTSLRHPMKKHGDVLAIVTIITLIHMTDIITEAKLMLVNMVMLLTGDKVKDMDILIWFPKD